MRDSRLAHLPDCSVVPTCEIIVKSQWGWGKRDSSAGNSGAEEPCHVSRNGECGLSALGAGGSPGKKAWLLEVQSDHVARGAGRGRIGLDG